MKTNSKIIIASLLICGVIAAVFISNKVGKDNNEVYKILHELFEMFVERKIEI